MSDDLKKDVDEIIQNDNIDLEDFKKTFTLVGDYLENKQFILNLSKIIDIITLDRNGDTVFDFADLKILATDFMAIGSIMSGLILVLESVPTIKLKYSSQTTEKIIFQLLAYVFLVLVPSKVGKKWSVDERQKVANIIIDIYNIVKASAIVQSIGLKIREFFQKKGWCKCICEQVDHQEVFEQKAPEIVANISSNINRQRDITSLQNEIANLKSQLDGLKN